MPPVTGPAIRARAARLRAAGDAARDRWLAAQAGRTGTLLMETPTLGRTETFAETFVDRPQEVGTLVPARILGARDGRLIAATSRD